MTREERIEMACDAVFTHEAAKDAFRKTAAVLPEYSVFWNTDADEAYAILERHAPNIMIEFYDIS